MSDKRVLFMLTQGPGHCDLSLHIAIASKAQTASALVMGDGAYLVTGGHLAPLADAGVKLFALRDSVEARGLTARVDQEIEMIDYKRWADLIMVEHDIVM